MAHYFLVDHDKRLIVVLSPKCACTSLRDWFTTVVTGRPGPHANGLEANPRIRPETIPSYTSYHRVLFLRDPLRRLVSFYADKVVHGSDRDFWAFADQDHRFRLERKTFRQVLFVLDHLRRHGMEYQHHLVPQLRRIEGVEFDEVITIEHLEEGLGRLNRRLGLTIPLSRRNRQPYRGSPAPAADRPPAWLREHGCPAPEYFYDDETRALAVAAFAEDVAYYDRIARSERHTP